jgi:hypothetical protein
MCVLAGCGSASARGGSVRGPQLDIVLRTQVGMGAGMNAPLHFPDARFTFFAFEDPTFCLTGMQLFDSSGSVIGGELFERPTFVANVPVPLVQQDLPAGDYRRTTWSSFNYKARKRRFASRNQAVTWGQAGPTSRCHGWPCGSLRN